MVRVRLAPPPTSRRYWARTSSSSRAKPAKRSGGATGDRAKKRPRQHPAARSSSSKGQSSRSASASSSSSSSSSSSAGPQHSRFVFSTQRVHDLTEAKSSSAPPSGFCAPPQASLQLNRTKNSHKAVIVFSSRARAVSPPPKPRSFSNPASPSCHLPRPRRPLGVGQLTKQAVCAEANGCPIIYHNMRPCWETAVGSFSSVVTSRAKAIAKRDRIFCENRLQDKWRPIEIGVRACRTDSPTTPRSSLFPRTMLLLLWSRDRQDIC